MKRVVVAGLALACLAVTATPARALGWLHCCRAACDVCVRYEVRYEQREVLCYKPVWKEEKVQVQRPKTIYKEVVEKVPVTVCTPRWVDVKREVEVCTPICREEIRDVCRLRRVPVCYIDPCTGCEHTCFKLRLVHEQVKRMVPDRKCETKIVTEKVCHIDREVKVVDRKRLVSHCVPETVTVTRRVCHMEPYRKTILVPVCVPCAPGQLMPRAY